MKRPAFQFYPGDWLRDPAVRACSLPARGLWIDMICIMHQSEPYGHLALNGHAIDAPLLARMVGGSAREVTALLAELERAGVFDRAEDGRIISRRMVRDEEIRSARAEGGKLGGNPALKGMAKEAAKDKPKVVEKVNLPPNLPPTPSSSSSSSSSTPKDSDADASGGKPPAVAPVDVIFGMGIPLLTAAGVPDKSARSMLGLMRKQHSDDAVVAALQRCVDERPLEPVAFLQGCVKAAVNAPRQTPFNAAAEKRSRTIAALTGQTQPDYIDVDATERLALGN